MSIKKIGLTISLFAAFGLTACGDDSSSGSGFDEKTKVTCDFTDGETSYKIVAKGGDYFSSEESSYKGSSLKTIIISTLPDEAIEEMCSDEDVEIGDMMKTSCDGNKMTQEMTVALASEDYAKGAFEKSKEEAKKRCSDIDGKTIGDLKNDFDDDEEGLDEENNSKNNEKNDNIACDEECQNQELENQEQEQQEQEQQEQEEQENSELN